MSEYADAAQSTAFALFRKLAKQGPPKTPKHDVPISLGQLVEEVEPVEKYYNDLIVFDPERNAIIIPFGSMPEIDLDEIKESKDLLLCVLALLGRTPFGWTDEDWDSPYFVQCLAKRIADIKGNWIRDYQ